MSRKQTKDSPAVHRVKGGTAPRPLAKTRSGGPRPKPGPITIRYADGRTKTVQAKDFERKHGPANWQKIDREFGRLLRQFRATGAQKALNELRAFAEREGMTSRLDSALSRGAASGPESAHWR